MSKDKRTYFYALANDRPYRMFSVIDRREKGLLLSLLGGEDLSVGETESPFFEKPETEDVCGHRSEQHISIHPDTVSSDRTWISNRLRMAGESNPVNRPATQATHPENGLIWPLFSHRQQLGFIPTIYKSREKDRNIEICQIDQSISSLYYCVWIVGKGVKFPVTDHRFATKDFEFSSYNLVIVYTYVRLPTILTGDRVFLSNISEIGARCEDVSGMDVGEIRNLTWMQFDVLLRGHLKRLSKLKGKSPGWLEDRITTQEANKLFSSYQVSPMFTDRLFPQLKDLMDI